VLILWFGWYGFNCGSTLTLTCSHTNIAGKLAFTTTISAATACLVSTALAKFIQGTFNVLMGLNCILAGLVGINASCTVVNPWMAVIICTASAGLLHLGHYFILWRLQINDPCDVCIIHCFCCRWGLIAVCIFCRDNTSSMLPTPT
jgi:Amt family ammonium transporter